ncbi:hypothetical protein EJ04DRAFT_240069 [Polyplosphaeria fusca]|uniref:Uncharacterized protein n=1 Tax=Polyplosphaeria fusca TaxID=682080 RepID=A0A9P4V562_9PLEO|nr:hypothetical protein EJ04DRAFT_240069 [Polyplosphaeria fusca]
MFLSQQRKHGCRYVSHSLPILLRILFMDPSLLPIACAALRPPPPSRPHILLYTSPGSSLLVSTSINPRPRPLLYPVPAVCCSSHR